MGVRESKFLFFDEHGLFPRRTSIHYIRGCIQTMLYIVGDGGGSLSKQSDGVLFWVALRMFLIKNNIAKAKGNKYTAPSSDKQTHQAISIAP